MRCPAKTQARSQARPSELRVARPRIDRTSATHRASSLSMAGHGLPPRRKRPLIAARNRGDGAGDDPINGAMSTNRRGRASGAMDNRPAVTHRLSGRANCESPVARARLERQRPSGSARPGTAFHPCAAPMLSVDCGAYTRAVHLLGVSTVIAAYKWPGPGRSFEPVIGSARAARTLPNLQLLQDNYATDIAALRRSAIKGASPIRWRCPMHGSASERRALVATRLPPSGE